MGENEEWMELYPKFAEIAKAEGFPQVAAAFKMIASIEAKHEKKYLKLLDNLAKGVVFEKEGDVYWMCRKCGYIHKGAKAPQTCPACLHPQAYFELHMENY